MLEKLEGWMVVTMDQCEVMARVRDARVDDIKATIIKEK